MGRNTGIPELSGWGTRNELNVGLIASPEEGLHTGSVRAADSKQAAKTAGRNFKSKAAGS
jgi:hypothetical protein